MILQAGLCQFACPRSPGHLLGTDDLDAISRLIFGSQVSLVVGLIVVIISSTIGVTLGALAGISAAFWTVSSARRRHPVRLPFLILAITIVSVVGPSLIT